MRLLLLGLSSMDLNYPVGDMEDALERLIWPEVLGLSLGHGVSGEEQVGRKVRYLL